MVAKGPYCCLNAGFIPHAGIMFVQFQNQVWFFMGFHDFFKIPHTKGIWGTFKRGDINRKKILRPGRHQGGLEDGGSMLPVNFLKKRLNGVKIMMIQIQHILEKGVDLHGGKNIRDARIKTL